MLRSPRSLPRCWLSPPTTLDRAPAKLVPVIKVRRLPKATRGPLTDLAFGLGLLKGPPGGSKDRRDKRWSLALLWKACKRASKRSSTNGMEGGRSGPACDTLSRRRGPLSKSSISGPRSGGSPLPLPIFCYSSLQTCIAGRIPRGGVRRPPCCNGPSSIVARRQGDPCVPAIPY